MYSDKEIIKGIKTGNGKVLKFVYKNHFPAIRNMIVNNSGTNDDAEDIFQDALVITYKNLVYREVVLSSTIKTYVYAICRNLWLQKITKAGKNRERNNEMKYETNIIAEEENNMQESGKYELYRKHFRLLSEDCRKILTMFLKKIPLKDIAATMNHKSVDYTKTRKYLCKKALKKGIFNDPDCKKYISHE